MRTDAKLNFKGLKINAKGNMEFTLETKGELKPDQILAFHQLKTQGDIFGAFSSAQMDIDDYGHDEVRTGVPYKVDAAGAVQLTIADASQPEAPQESEDVDDIEDIEELQEPDFDGYTEDLPGIDEDEQGLEGLPDGVDVEDLEEDYDHSYADEGPAEELDTVEDLPDELN